MRRRVATGALAALLSAVLSRAPLPGLAAATAAPQAARRELFKDSRALLAMARANGKANVSLVMAARPGKTDSVAREIRRLGGRIRIQEDDIGYLRARVPIERVEELVAFDKIQTVDVDQDASSIPPYLQPALGTGDPETRLPRARAAPPGEDWPPSRVDLTLRPIYSPLKDLGALDWRREHPTFDGRGVTVAVLDGNVDFLLPEFQVATTLDGKPTRKVVDVLNSMDPLEPEADFPHWISMRTWVTARDGEVEFGGETYQAPHPGTFRIGIVDLCRFALYVQAYFRAVLDRPGLSTSVDKPIGVLWEERSGDVWVDTNQNRSFADEKPLQNFAERGDHALLGVDDPDTPVRETIPAVVQTAKADGFVAINFGLYGHSTMVSGALLASRGTDGRFNGVAPGARLVSIFQGSTTHGMTEGLIRAFRDPRVDVVLLEENVFIAMPYVIGDGRFTVTEICSRLIEKYRKPFLVPANNAPGLNTTIEHGMARHGFGVGAYESRENFLANKAVRVFENDNLHWVGSWGPSGNGALQPDILSPSEVLTTHPASRPSDGLNGVFEFSPGYEMCGGTSCATPVAAGALSLLVSGAKQTGLSWAPPSLYRAVTATARYLPNIPANRQGNGLIQVGSAWDMLRKLSNASRPIDIEIRAPVRTALSAWLEPSNSGPGLFEREGWAAGDQGERRIVLTRRSGSSAPVTLRLKWIGNDGTFSSAETIVLPLGKPVGLPVQIAPETPGVHSALLSIEDPAAPCPVGRLMAAIVAAERFDAAGKYTITKEVRAPRPGAAEVFFEVPAGVDAFKVELKAPKETVRMSLYPPDGREDTVYQPLKDDLQVRTIADPAPGVWGVVLSDMHDAFKFDESRPPTLPRTPVTLTASLVGVNLTVPPLEAASGSAQEIRLSAKNRLAGFKGSIASLPLATVREARGSLDPRQQRVFDVTVPKGTERLMIEIEGIPTPDADLDFYLFDCTGKSCEPRRARVGSGSREGLSLDNPAPGTWKGVVDAARLPAGRIEFTYREYLLDPALGAVLVADGSTQRETDSSWDARAILWVAGTAPEGRELCAVLAAAAEGVASARQIGGMDLGSFESWKVGQDAIPLGLATIRLGKKTATTAATPNASEAEKETK
ncbi:MAG: S8 family serine peptidase [Thermoanaerobaculia bacterium]